MSIQINISARKDVDALLSLLDGEQSDAFWRVLAERAATKIGRRVTDPPATAMGDDEARAFEQSIVPFGVHAGERVLDVDQGYWIAIRESDFNRKLSRYIQSQVWRDRQPEGD